MTASTDPDRVDPATGRTLRQPYVENRPFANFALRIIAATGRRAALDPDALPYLAALANEADLQLHFAVTQLREQGYSWADIGRRLDMTRQSAQERFGRTTARTRGSAPTTVTAAALHPSTPAMGIAR